MNMRNLFSVLEILMKEFSWVTMLTKRLVHQQNLKLFLTNQMNVSNKIYNNILTRFVSLLKVQKLPIIKNYNGNTVSTVSICMFCWNVATYKWKVHDWKIEVISYTIVLFLFGPHCQFLGVAQDSCGICSILYCNLKTL